MFDFVIVGGGSGSINAMIYIRGHRRDYDRWAELGNEGWAFADVLPYFKRGQHQERGGSTYHGVGGPLNVADLRSPNALSHAFVAAALELGFPRNNDFNGPEQEGFGLYQVTQRRGQRHSAAAAYLKPALKRPNLTVQTHAHVTRICWQGTRATGVEYQQEEQTHEVLASKEVILCGGAINSPQLLLLSGVGPGEHLQETGIPVVAELSGVGRNLQDHVAVPLVYDCTQPGTLEDAESIVNLIKFLLFGRGPLTSNVGEAGGFIKTRPKLDVPDIQYHFAPAYYLDHGFTKREGNGMTFGPTLIHPESRGHIRLRSADPLAPPAIQPNYLDSQADMVSLLEGLKVARQLAHAQAFAAVRGPEFWPGKEVQTD